MNTPLRLAMWSGPRNISTALMRSWENRSDTMVVDEPLYSHYLFATGVEGHPISEEIIAHYGTDWQAEVERLTGPLPQGVDVFYQKHMAHHLLPAMDRGWLKQLTNCFLIRNPREMLISLGKVLPQPELKDTGLETQVELFRMLKEATGTPPPVIDSRDVLEHPRGLLSALCVRLGIPFQDAMLEWPPGPRDSDGIWAPHWYGVVEKSTGFHPYSPSAEALPQNLEPVLAACTPLYQELADHKLTA